MKLNRVVLILIQDPVYFDCLQNEISLWMNLNYYHVENIRENIPYFKIPENSREDKRRGKMREGESEEEEEVAACRCV